MEAENEQYALAVDVFVLLDFHRSEALPGLAERGLQRPVPKVG